ncbi:UNVERIFIED_CONTAM: hypothetical protein PYX00_000688 [Menopon gallinae]|uniref:Uncharacterized protein n=1 Tax=Menopon gallinae TaxID=328185 RepID=A0AAW2IA77_9NEOP
MKNKGAVNYNNVTQAQEPSTYDSAPEQLKDVHKFTFNHEHVPNGIAKPSVSDCTINTRNTSLVSEDIADVYADKLNTFSSTTRVKKVQNWIADQKPKIDKRQSVITVIGQTQGQSPLSSALHEIDQRRKLVKELDKYAICNKITNSEKDKEISTLVAQINFLSPSGRLLYSGDRKVDLRDLPCRLKHAGHLEGGDKSRKNFEMKYDVPVQCDTEGITEQDTSATPSSDSSNDSQKKLFCSTWTYKYDVKGKIRRTLSRIPYNWVAYFMILLSGTLCWYTYVSIQRNGFFIFDLFPQKPKTTTWYEKVCYWIWEIFRPSGSYHRSTSWGHR